MIRSFFLVLVLVGGLGLSACTSEAATNTTYDDFRALVESKNWEGAYSMLTDASKNTFPNKAETLKALCEGPLAVGFGDHAGVRNSKLINGNVDHVEGELQVFDETGKLVRPLGRWVAIRSEIGTWQVDWQLPTSVEIASRGDPFATQN